VPDLDALASFRMSEPSQALEGASATP
jgi:hypothetical protein